MTECKRQGLTGLGRPPQNDRGENSWLVTTMGFSPLASPLLETGTLASPCGQTAAIHTLVGGPTGFYGAIMCFGEEGASFTGASSPSVAGGDPNVLGSQVN